MNVFFDFETRAGRAAPDLKKCGAYRYANSASAIALAYAIEDGPVRIIDKGGQPLSWDDLPELHGIFNIATFIAWNCSFDRAIWNYSLLDSPFLEPGKVKDAMAVALANNLPADLERASTTLTGRGKMVDGKRLIGLICSPDGVNADTHPDEWKQFRAYASIDVARLREAWRIMRPLPDNEWKVYAASEAINDRGIPIDLAFVEKAERLVAQELARTNQRLNEITNGEVVSVYAHERIASWLYNRLDDAEARDILVSYIAEPGDEDEDAAVDEDGNEIELAGTPVLTCRKANLARLVAYLRSRSSGSVNPELLEVAELRLFGASTSIKKFGAMLNQHVNGHLHGQIVFNGAGQTGRFSGKGVQPQNMTRSVLGDGPGDDYGTYEAPTIDLIADGCDLAALARHGLGEPPAKKLSLVVRPAVMAPIGRTLIKCDYSQIEARVLPFLTGGTYDDMPILAAFKDVDEDPSKPDIYKITSSGMLHKSPSEISSPERQRGKVAVLACGFQGGRNALMSMALNYDMYLSPSEAQIIVDQWRAANPWALKLWGKHNSNESFGLYGAACRAVNAPGTSQRHGRILFVYNANYLGGTLLMRLPSGRLLTYPWCKFREYQIKDKNTKAVIDTRYGLTFKRTGGIVALYGGRFAENATQAAAADLLREALVDLEAQFDAVIMHAHDEITLEVEESETILAQKLLRSIMLRERPWAVGLPLAVEMTTRFYYSSTKLKKENVHHAIQGQTA